MSCEALLVQELKARGLRLTPQREMVLDALHVLRGHASVDEIYRQVSLRCASMDKSTVYRALGLLQELGLVVQVDLGDNVLRYELATHGPHIHLLCERCERMTTLRLADMTSLAERLRQREGFVMAEHQVIRGLCPACAEGAHSGAN
ncbi:MAG: transcriptional repressor [Chloroflexi bacterium]|nr:transcriptional repressor [Chloroflexota bacterium]